MKPIYVPKGAAREYGDYALNIYTGCPHQCFYCFAPSVLRKTKQTFYSCVEPRKNIIAELQKQLESENIKDKLIHLCFTCDPYPRHHDNNITREVIKLIKMSGNHVQILTKNADSIKRDFDLFNDKDWIGTTISCDNLNAEEFEPLASNPKERIKMIKSAKNMGFNTWLSCEPVINPNTIYEILKCYSFFIDKINIGKLNYYPSQINWKEFGFEVERLCNEYGWNYYIKESLRAEMN